MQSFASMMYCGAMNSTLRMEQEDLEHWVYRFTEYLEHTAQQTTVHITVL